MLIICNNNFIHKFCAYKSKTEQKSKNNFGYENHGYYIIYENESENIEFVL